MEYESEEPTRHLFVLSPPIFKLGKLGKSMRDRDVFMVGRLVVAPLG